MTRVIIILSLLCFSVNADNVKLLNKEYEEFLKLKRSKILDEKESTQNSWISPWSIDVSMNKSSSFAGTRSTAKKISLGFSQDIYRSGGIGFLIDYADKKYKYDASSLQSEHYSLIYSIYDLVLQINMLKLQIKQNYLFLQNQDIEIFIKKLQHESGKLDLIELNNAIMDKNSRVKETVSLKNSFNSKIKELSKLTDLKYDEIEILDFKEIDKEGFAQKNIAYNIEYAKEKMLEKEYQKDKSDYMPSVALYGELGYSQSTNDTLSTSQSGDNYSIGVNLSIPLDYYEKTKTNISKKEYLIQKQNTKIAQKESLAEYNQVFMQIEAYKEHNELLKSNIKLYDDLIDITNAKVKSGYSSQYDLDILKNTRQNDILELKINDMSIKQQLSKLYFKMMR